MVRATGTLAGVNELLSDTPTDINIIRARVTVIATAISAIADELTEKVKQAPGPIDKALEEEIIARMEPLQHELALLLAAKRRWEAQQR